MSGFQRPAKPLFAMENEAPGAVSTGPGGTCPQAGKARPARPWPAAGFTLIEVMVALAITALALVAGIKAAGSLADNAARQSRVLLGRLCAENALVELKLLRQFPGAGDSTLACEQAGQRFEVQLAIRATPNPNFRRVEAIARQEGLTVIQISTLVGRY